MKGDDGEIRRARSDGHWGHADSARWHLGADSRACRRYGYTLDQPRAELFSHSQFRDVTARVIAKRDGRLVRIGDVAIDRRLIPQRSPICRGPVDVGSFSSKRPERLRYLNAQPKLKLNSLALTLCWAVP